MSTGERKRGRKATSVISVQINENNEIECMEMDENSQDTQDSQYLDMSEASSPPQVTINVQEETVVEHVCGKCGKVYRSLGALKRHLDLCRSVDYDSAEYDGEGIPQEDEMQGIEVIHVKKEQNELSEITMENYKVSEDSSDTFKKPLPKKVSPKKVSPKKVPKEKGTKSPKRLCYCCDEDLASAHVSPFLRLHFFSKIPNLGKVVKTVKISPKAVFSL